MSTKAMTNKNEYVSSDIFPLTLHSRHMFRYSELLRAVDLPLKLLIAKEEYNDGNHHHSSSFKFAHRLLLSFYTLTPCLHTIATLSADCLNDLEENKVEQLDLHICRVQSMFDGLAKEARMVATDANKAFLGIEQWRVRCAHTCLRAQERTRDSTRRLTEAGAELQSFNMATLMALQHEEGTRLGYALLLCANVVFIPVRQVFNPPFIDKLLLEARCNYERSVNIADNVINKRLKVVQRHSKLVSDHATVVARREHAEMAVLVCDNGDDHLLLAVSQWHDLHACLKSLRNFWQRFSACCGILRQLNSTSQRPSDMREELKQTIKVLAQMFLVNHIEARNEWLRFLETETRRNRPTRLSRT